MARLLGGNQTVRRNGTAPRLYTEWVALIVLKKTVASSGRLTRGARRDHRPPGHRTGESLNWIVVRPLAPLSTFHEHDGVDKVVEPGFRPLGDVMVEQIVGRRRLSRDRRRIIDLCYERAPLLMASSPFENGRREAT